MTKAISPSELLLKIGSQKQDIHKLSFCGSSKASEVQKWVDSLKATQLMQTSASLYSAVPEISRLKTDYVNRFEILEILRPIVQNSILGLSKHFLKQPLVLPKDAQRAAIVALSLQKNMADGYLVTITEIVNRGKANSTTLGLLSKAIHRAITGISYLFLRSYQMYTQTPPSLWQKLHTLYITATYFELESASIVDPLLQYSRSQTIQSAYIRALMMATAKCNQLTQNNVSAIFSVFENWSQYVKIESLQLDSESFYGIDFLSDEPPRYKSSIEPSAVENCKEINFSILIRHLGRYLDDDEDQQEDLLQTVSEIVAPKDFPSKLYSHLARCWREMSKRQLERRDIQGTAEICVGLVDCHFYLCNGQEFNFFIKNSGKEEHDQDINVFTPRDLRINNSANFSRPVYRVALQNASAGGYCLLWKGEVDVKVEAGELLGIKEVGRRTWSIGVVRWIKQVRQGSQLGIQLLSSNPKPYGIAQTYDMGGYAEFSRSIYIPSSRFGSTSASLLTPAVPFQAFSNVKILDGDQEYSAKLERNLFSSGSIAQFAFRPLNDDTENNPEKNDKSDNFNSHWE